MLNTNNPLLARFNNAPALLSDSMETTLIANLDHAFVSQSQIERMEIENRAVMQDDFWPDEDSWLAFFRPYNVRDGILQIPVKGVLLNGFPYQDGEWATGYEYIRRAMDRGMDDPAVKGIALVIDSGGGMVSGNFDLVDSIFAARGEKPIRAFASEHAYSAAYSIASAADTITVARTGGVGSIGVVTAHFDFSKMLEKAGVAVTFIHFGAHKVDGNQFEPLPDDVKARIQERIDTLGEVFVSTVARNRGMDAEAVRATEALTFTALEATSNGLADAIGSLDDSMAAFAAELSTAKGTIMSAQTTKETAGDPAAAIETARTEGFAAGRAEGQKEGATAERTRITTILGSDAGKARPTMALKMATGEKFAALDADTVVEMLADMPEEKAEADTGTNATGKNFVDTMNAGKNADVGTPGDGESAGEMSRAQRTLAMTKGAPKKKS